MSQISVDLGAAPRTRVLGQTVCLVFELDPDGRHVFHGPGHGGSEGRRSGCEQDEYLKALKHKNKQTLRDLQ